MGKASQAKGKRGEEEITGILRGYGYDVTRGASQNYGSEPDVAGLPGIHLEIKRAEHLRLNAAVEQAKRDSERFQDGLPAVIHRANKQPWKVTMLLSDWLQLYDRLPF